MKNKRRNDRSIDKSFTFSSNDKNYKRIDSFISRIHFISRQFGGKKEKEEKFVKIGTPIIREFRHMRAIPRRNLHVHVCTLMRVRGTSCFSSKHPRNLVQKHQRRAAG